MNRVARISAFPDWRQPGCDARCAPRRHDPEAHEEYGYQKGLDARRQRVVRTGPLAVDLAACRVTVDGEPVRVTAREWAVLSLLAQRPGELASAHEMVVAIWGEEMAKAPLFYRSRPRGNATLGGQSLRVTVDRLRGKLGPAARLIETVKGIGYRLSIEEAVS